MMILITVRLWEIFTRQFQTILQMVNLSNFFPGQDSQKGYCPHSPRRIHNTTAMPKGAGAMSAPTAHILGNWSVVVAAVGGLALLIAAVRYRIPDLARRLEKMEKTKHPSETDLETAVTSFQTVCKFNQVSCQKTTACQINQVRNEFTKQLSGLVELVNKQAVIIARVDERVAAIHRNHDAASLPAPRVVKNE